MNQAVTTVAIPISGIVEARNLYKEYSEAAIDIDEAEHAASPDNALAVDVLRRLFPEGLPEGFVMEIRPCEREGYRIHIDLIRRLLDALGLTKLIIDGVAEDSSTVEAMR